MALTDFGHLIGFKNYLNITILIVCLIVLSSQMVYYYNYKHNISPKFVGIFQMMSGSVTPSSLKLFKVRQMTKLVRLTRFTFVLADMFVNTSKVFVILLILVAYMIGTNLRQTWFYLALCLVAMIYLAHILTNFIVYQFLYFFVICQYVVIKLNNLNECVSQSRNRFNLKNILHSYDTLYREINNYNTTYWSKFLFIIWLYYGLAINQILYMTIFSDITIPKIIFGIILIELVVILWFIIFTASLVNTSAKKSYKLFNSHFVRNESNSSINKLKLSTFICRLSKNKVGFTCWNLFMMDQFRSYGVIQTLSNPLIQMSFTLQIIIFLSRMQLKLIMIGQHLH